MTKKNVFLILFLLFSSSWFFFARGTKAVDVSVGQFVAFASSGPYYIIERNASGAEARSAVPDTDMPYKEAIIESNNLSFENLRILEQSAVERYPLYRNLTIKAGARYLLKKYATNEYFIVDHENYVKKVNKADYPSYFEIIIPDVYWMSYNVMAETSTMPDLKPIALKARLGLDGTDYNLNDAGKIFDIGDSLNVSGVYENSGGLYTVEDPANPFHSSLKIVKNGKTYLESIQNSNSGAIAGIWVWAPAEAGIYTLVLTLDKNNVINESDEGNNTLEKTITVNSNITKPDLIVKDVYFYPSTPQYGGKLLPSGGIAVKIKNIGSVVAPNLAGINFSAYVYNEKGNSLTGNGITMKDYPTLQPDEEHTYIVKADTFEPYVFNEKNIKIKAIVDTSNFYSESNENNNTLEKTITVNATAVKPDLVVTDLKIDRLASWDSEDTKYVWVSFKNLGGVEGRKTIKTKVTDLVNNEIYYMSVETNLTGGDVNSLSVNSPVKNLYSVHKLKAEIDIDNTIDESNENNNSFEKTVTVNGLTGMPDLIAKDIKMLEGRGSYKDLNRNPKVGEEFYFMPVYTNNGDVKAGIFNIDGYVDGEYNARLYIGSGMAANSVSDSSGNPFAATFKKEGKHVIKIVLDPDKKVHETNEDNNIFEKTILVSENGTGISEQVKCVFKGSQKEQKCWGDVPSAVAGGEPVRYSCSGVESCIVTVKGSSNSVVTWGSSCGGSYNTKVDGKGDYDQTGEYAKFNCANEESAQVVSEQVKCVFKGSQTEQKCYMAANNEGPGCTGAETCVLDVKGKKGEKITWKSTCGGYAFTKMDGQSDYAEFDCTSVGAEFINNAKEIIADKYDNILAELKQLRDTVKEQQNEIKYLKSMTADLRDISDKMKGAINDFITYGVDANTQKLGAGERAAVINSYKAAFDKLPETEAEMTDAIKIANGRFPSMTSDAAEKAAKEQFIKIYKRIADMNDAQDVAAIKVMAYGLKQKAENRNLNSEKSGIKTFKAIFGSTPKTTEDWNTMQAITYSGAAREKDSDGDLLSDEMEKDYGTNPNKADTDGDGFKDGVEVNGGYNPKGNGKLEVKN